MRNRSIRFTWMMFAAAFGALIATAGPGVVSAAAAQGVTKQRQAESQEVLDLNSATVEQLTSLPGIGPEKARAIVARRERQPFVRVEEILRVRGIGRATFRRLRSLITVRPHGRRSAGRQR